MNWGSLFSGLEKVGNVFAAAGNAGQATIVPPPPQPESYYVGQQSLYPQGAGGASVFASSTTWILLGLAAVATIAVILIVKK